MRNEIESSLQALIGQPLLSAGRAADLEWFQFGKPQTVMNSRGETKTVGEYALHIQCAWRIRDSAGIIVASRDRYEPAEADDVGSLRILLSTDVAIELFPDSSEEDEYSEHWRFFQSTSGTKHLVVRNGGCSWT